MSHPVFTAGRIRKCAQIDDLSEDVEFTTSKTVFLLPKEGTDATHQVMKVRLEADSEYADVPFVVGDWNVPLVRGISADNADVLNDYYIFVGN